MQGLRDMAPAEIRGRIVAVMLTHSGYLCLLRRSRSVGSDRGRWHCVTGHLPAQRLPASQALVEVFEETGLTRADLTSMVPGPVLRLPDERGGYWIVHPYRCEVSRTDIRLNWENDGVRWVDPSTLDALPIVEWFPHVARALRGVACLADLPKPIRSPVLATVTDAKES